MSRDTTLKRFLDAQQSDYATALSEIQNGRKRSHWVWYIFPQMQGLGYSEMARYYGIKNLQEAEDYLHHPVLGKRLIEISNALLPLQSSNATSVMGSPDDLKLKSSMTLFAAVPEADPVFQQVLDKFYQGSKDQQTLQMLK